MADTTVVTSAQVEAWLRAAAGELNAHADELTALDSAIGDADHGTNMARGFAAVLDKLDAAGDDVPGIQPLLKSVGMTLISKVGGASGSLYGTLFLDMGKAAPAATEVSVTDFAAIVAAGVAGVVGRGHAMVGDKTMIDALDPAVTALTSWIRVSLLHQQTTLSTQTKQNAAKIVKIAACRTRRYFLAP